MRLLILCGSVHPSGLESQQLLHHSCFGHTAVVKELVTAGDNLPLAGGLNRPHSTKHVPLVLLPDVTPACLGSMHMRLSP